MLLVLIELLCLSNCIAWLQIEPGDERTGGRPDVSDEDVQDLLIESNDRICTRCKETGASIGCEVRSCKRVFHFLCARRVRCDFHVAVRSTPRVLCPRHTDVDLRQQKQQSRRQVSQRVHVAGLKPGLPASSTVAIEYEWVKIDGEFKRVRKETKTPAPAVASAHAPAPAQDSSASGAKKPTTKRVSTIPTTSSTVKPTNEFVPINSSGGELLLPAILRQKCRSTIREILNRGGTPKDDASDDGNIDVVDLTSPREEIITLDTAVLRLEIALYVAFPFLDTDTHAGAASKHLSATGERIPYPVAVAALQTLLLEKVAVASALTAAIPSNGDADGLLAQVLAGQICSEQLSPIIADAVATATTAPTADVKEQKDEAGTAAVAATEVAAVDTTVANPEL